MPDQRDEVHELGETQEIGFLAKVSEAVCLLKVEAVLEIPIEGLLHECLALYRVPQLHPEGA